MKTKTKKILSVVLSVCILLSVIPMFAFSASAEQTAVSYRYPVYNSDGVPTSGIKEWKTGSCESYTAVTSSTSEVTWTGGWYVASGEVTIGDQVTISGAVHLILMDGCNLTVTGATTNKAGIFVTGDNSFTVYGQTIGNGKLTATGFSNQAGIGGNTSGDVCNRDGKNITINGGTITATGGSNAAGIGGANGGTGSSIRGAGLNITINGGTVTATSGSFAAGIGGGKSGYAQDITINGGTIAATGSTVAGIGGNISKTIRIIIATTLVVKAGSSADPTGEIENSGSDISSSLKGKKYVTVTPKAYAVTCATCTNGSVSADKQTAIEGAEITLSNTPSTGYVLDSYKVYKTGDENTTVAVTDSKFTMPAFAVTVGATFKAKTYVCYIDKNENGTFDGSDVKYDTIAKAITAAGTTDTTIRLIADVTENVVINAGQTIILDLNGYVLKGDGTTSVINNNGTLTITDSDTTAQTHKVHNFKVGDDGLWTLTTDDKTVDFESLTSRPATDAVVAVKGGCITGGKGTIQGQSAYGGGIYNNGTLTLQGGNIAGNLPEGEPGYATYGGGVYNAAGKTFTMRAGSVIGNSAHEGGGVYNEEKTDDKGTFNFEGGVISYNLARDTATGGGICNLGIFNMSGGIVSANNAAESGGGLYNSGTVTISKGTISGNTAKFGGGIYSSDKITMTDGSITGNKATTYGGGAVEVEGNCTVGGTAQITGNTVNGAASNLVLLDTIATLGTGDNAPKTNMSVGVTLLNEDREPVDGAFTENGENADKYHFFSDSDVYGVKYNDNGYLELVEIDYSTTPKMNYSANLTLAKNIDVGLTVAKNKDSAVAITSKKLKIYANGKEITLNDGLKGILASVVPNEIGKPIAVSVEYDGIIVKGFGYSVTKYCNAVFKAYANDNATYAKLNTLCEAILNYGKYAEDYYNQEGDGDRNADESTVNEGHELDLSTVTLPTSKKVFTKNASYGDTGSSTNLELGSTIKLQYIVKATVPYELELVSGMTNAKAVEDGKYKTGDIPYMQSFFILTGEGNDKVQIDPSKIEVSETSGGYVISVDLYAYQLNKEYTLKVKDVDLTSFGITYGVYDYCVEAQEYCTEAVANLCKAIYNYSEAVSDYIG